jgi:hypothetical protein
MSLKNAVKGSIVFAPAVVLADRAALVQRQNKEFFYPSI